MQNAGSIIVTIGATTYSITFIRFWDENPRPFDRLQRPTMLGRFVFDAVSSFR